MVRYFVAVTFDVCEKEDLFIDMNGYPFDSSVNMDRQVREYAKWDIAPLVKVFESKDGNFEELELYQVYIFEEYECDCSDIPLKDRLIQWIE